MTKNKLFTCSLTVISNGIAFEVDVDFGDGSGIQKLTLTDSSASFQHSFSSVGFYVLSASVENSNLYLNPIITSELQDLKFK